MSEAKGPETVLTQSGNAEAFQAFAADHGARDSGRETLGEAIIVGAAAAVIIVAVVVILLVS